MSTTKDIVSSFAEISKLMDLAEKKKAIRGRKVYACDSDSVFITVDP